MEATHPRVTLHREVTPPRREAARHRGVTLRRTLPEAETLQEKLGTLLATPQLTPRATLRGERVTLQTGVGTTLPLEHLQVGAALPVTLPPTLLAELIPLAIHLHTLQKQETLLATRLHTLLGVGKPQAIPPHMHQMKGKPRA